MRSMRGHLSLVPLMDLIQWAGNNKRSGTLELSDQGNHKKFYFQNGKIIFVWSECKGERIVDFLRLESSMSQQELQDNIEDSKSLGLPFIGYLISEQIISRDKMEGIIRMVAQTAIADALKWQTGEFEFLDDVPSFVLNGPVKLDTTQLLMESAKKFDETGLEKAVDVDHIIEEIRNNIIKGNIELPTIPDIIQKIHEQTENPKASIDEIINCITDQILVSKILKICNSPYYRNASNVSTLKEAVVLIGLKSLQSIVTVHALSSFSPRNADGIRKVLQHSLVCGMLARQVARDMNSNFELAFMCGLLHDIGKTILFDLLHDYMLSPELRAKIIEDYHTEIGSLLAKKWNFSEDIQESIRFHHAPQQATINRSMVEIVHLANIMAHSSDQSGSTEEMFLRMALATQHSNSSISSINIQQDQVNNLLEQVENLELDAWEIVG